MQHRLTLRTAGLLTLPPLLWAGNAVIGRLMAGQVPPITLNFLRWALALLLLLPAAGWLLRKGSPLWPHWPLRRARPARGRLLQRAAVPGPEDVHAAERDAGRRQHAGLDARDRRPVLRPAHLPAPARRRGAVDRRRAGRAQPRRVGRAAAGAPGARRFLRAVRDRLLGALQLAAGAARRSAGDPRRLGRVPDGADGVRAWPGPGCSRPASGPARRSTSRGAGRWLPRWPTSRSGPPCWRTAAGDWGCSASAPTSPASSPTSRRCSRPCCRPRSWASCPTRTTRWRSR
jgi:hypothetical protein